MAKSLKIQRVYDIAAQYDKTIRSDDSRLQGYSVVQHSDGSCFNIDSSFLMTFADHDNVWLIVFPEHHDIQVWHTGDLTYWRWFPAPGTIPELKETP